MIKNTFILLVAVILASCTQKSAESKIDADRDTDAVRDTVVFDVRSAEEFLGGHLQDSINIPYTAISEKIGEHVKIKDAKIVLYCGSGKRAGIAQKTLTDMGYTDVTNAGGYKDLKK
jgi:phage shock protein E